MKNFCILICFICCKTLYAQDSLYNQKSKFSFRISSSYKVFMGDNFLAKSYKNQIGLVLDANLRLYKNWGVGLFFKTNNAKIKTTEFIGNSTNGRFTEGGPYIFYNKYLCKKWLFVPKIGFGGFNLKNRFLSELDNSKYYYRTNGTSYFVSGGLNYAFNKHIGLSLNTEYGFIQFPNIAANASAAGTGYKNASQFNTELGFVIKL